MNEQKHNDGQIALHRRIAESLSKQVNTGGLKPGEKLPSERKIADKFQASRATVRTALQHLEQAGLITRRDRRSAVVSIRRDMAPQLRIACSTTRLANLLGRLSDTQVLPPRCQLQQIDLHQPGAISQFALQPAMAADVLICELEHVNCFRKLSDEGLNFPSWLLSESLLSPVSRQVCGSNGHYLIVPLTISPMVVYFSQSAFADIQRDVLHSEQNWDQWREIMGMLTSHGRYGFQFRPTFSHVGAIMSSLGVSLYESDGKVAAKGDHAEGFEHGVRFIYDLLHVHRVSPLLARADQLNLFAEKRCAMALDGAEMFSQYHQILGDDLGITKLPRSGFDGGMLTGTVAVVLNERENLQPVQDFLRALTSLNTQRMLGQYEMGLPVREELLNSESIQSMSLPSPVGDLMLRELERTSLAPMPYSTTHKHDVETLFLELWLGLDNLDNICRRFRELS